MTTKNKKNFDVKTNVLPKFKVMIIPGCDNEKHAQRAALSMEAAFDNVIAGACSEDGGKTWGVYFERVDFSEVK